MGRPIKISKGKLRKSMPKLCSKMKLNKKTRMLEPETEKEKKVLIKLQEFEDERMKEELEAKEDEK